MSETIFEFEEHIKFLTQEGYTIDDERFRYVKGQSRLLMYLHDAINSLMLAKKTQNYEPNNVSTEHLLQQALLRNTVLNYTKCFSESGKGHISLDKNKVFKDAVMLQKIHEDIMSLRHKFFDHSDESGLDYVAFATKETKIVTKQLYTIVVPLEKFAMLQTAFLLQGSMLEPIYSKVSVT